MSPGEFLSLVCLVLIGTVVASALTFAFFPESVAVPSFSPPAAPTGAVPVPVRLPFVTEAGP